MKNIFYTSLVLFSLVFIKTSNAQVSVNINISSQPLWGPVGFDYVRYYYMPEINVYYNVSNRKYTYWKGNKWMTKSKLPKEYRNFDLYRTYKVVVNEHNPWVRHNHYRNKYHGFARNHSQVVIRDVRKHPHMYKNNGNHMKHSSKGRNVKRNHKEHSNKANTPNRR